MPPEAHYPIPLPGPRLRRHPDPAPTWPAGWPPPSTGVKRPARVGSSTSPCSARACGPCSPSSPAPTPRAWRRSSRSTGAGRPTRSGTCTARPTPSSSRCRCWSPTGTGPSCAWCRPARPPGRRTLRHRKAADQEQRGAASRSSTRSSPPTPWRSGGRSSAGRKGHGRPPRRRGRCSRTSRRSTTAICSG